MPVARTPLLAVAALVLTLAVASPAAGQAVPTLGAPETQTTSAAPPPVTDTTAGSSGLKTWQELMIFGAGLALIAGIAFAILGDAKERAARLRHGRPDPQDEGPLHRRPQQSKQRARQKARAARAQRRRNRAR
ncbi:MAG: hypothetical protein QOI62_857 [Solirubrobacteraceae bacterium]|jgi:hypothetical protein|nr:hypothetical protein [Solirubrobacteraceae bacterium]MEA2357597.1 hypothetical protein [Solirubrobacteraceae bacterium]